MEKVISLKHGTSYQTDEQLKKCCTDEAGNHGSENLIFFDIKTKVQLIMMKIMNNYFDLDEADENNFIPVVSRIMDHLVSSKDILENLSKLKNIDDYTFEHSVSVCVVSLVIGISMNYCWDELVEIGTGALLHDIGKLKISGEILKKPSRLTAEEFNEIKKHTLYGYQILKNNSNISTAAAYIALSHHERYDGSGYPMRLKGNRINKFARIVAVADVFDALFSDRVYRKKLCPREIIEYIVNNGSKCFDQEVIDKFINLVAIYPRGTKVVLNTGERGVVVSNNRGMPLSPVVRVTCNDNTGFIKSYEINLAVCSSIFIDRVCED